MAKRTNWMAWGLVGVPAATVTLMGTRVLRYSDLSPFNDQPFDRQTWLAVPQLLERGLVEESDNPRGRMAQDLLDHHIRPGMRREQAVELLGPPNGKVKDFEQAPGTPMPAEALVYHLGYWSGFRVDLDALYIYLDKAGRVMGAQVVQY